ncbi:unnamed protein product [Arctogadus glacialis]
MGTGGGAERKMRKGPRRRERAREYVNHIRLVMYCASMVLVLCWYWAGIGLVLGWYCAGMVLVVFWYCDGMVLVWSWLEPAEAGSDVGTDRDIVWLNGPVLDGRENHGPRQKVLTLVRKAD